MFRRESYIKRVFVFLVAFSLWDCAWAQGRFPEIKVSWVSDSFIAKTSEDVVQYGVQTFGTGVCKDRLIHYLDRIGYVRLDSQQSATDSVFQAIWGCDTLTFRVRPKIIRTFVYDKQQRKKLSSLEVESRIPPYTRFSAVIEGLDETLIEALKDSMLRMESPSPILFNNSQTCIFYALDALFQKYEICTDPVITRNTSYTREEELNAFFNHFLTAGESYPCRYKDIKEVVFPDNCVLAIVDDFGHIIHAVFYSEGLFYSKNGMFTPVAFNSLFPIMKSYGRWDTKVKGLSKLGKQLKGSRLVVYTINRKLFQIEE